MCGAPKAGVEHIWWERPALNGAINFGLQKLKQRRAKAGNKPAFPSAWSTLRDTDNMKAVEVCHPCRGQVKNVYTGSATTSWIQLLCWMGTLDPR
eukprot:5756667-Heterocapsa_arctica.AAC.1